VCVCARRDLKTSSCKMRACSSPICMCGSSASVHTYIMCAHISSSYGNTGNLGGPPPRENNAYLSLLFIICLRGVFYRSSIRAATNRQFQHFRSYLESRHADRGASDIPTARCEESWGLVNTLPSSVHAPREVEREVEGEVCSSGE
jgi:hypothetical protein